MWQPAGLAQRGTKRERKIPVSAVPRLVSDSSAATKTISQKTGGISLEWCFISGTGAGWGVWGGNSISKSEVRVGETSTVHWCNSAVLPEVFWSLAGGWEIYRGEALWAQDSGVVWGGLYIARHSAFQVSTGRKLLGVQEVFWVTEVDQLLTSGNCFWWQPQYLYCGKVCVSQRSRSTVSCALFTQYASTTWSKTPSSTSIFLLLTVWCSCDETI